MKREWLHKSAYELSNEDLFYYSQLVSKPKISLIWLWVITCLITSIYSNPLRTLFLCLCAFAIISCFYSIYRIQVKFGVKP